MKPPPFAYLRAGSADEAVELLAGLGDEAKVLAGGQSLIPLMSFRLARPTHLVDVNAARELDFIRIQDGTLAIGALTRHVSIERSQELTGPWSAFTEAAPHVGHYPIRVRGTFGGSISHGEPTAEFPLIALTLDAEVVARSRAGTRAIPAGRFFQGVFTTDLRPDELLVEVRVPRPPAGAVTVFDEFSERAGDFALASVCLGVAFRGDAVDWARVGLGGVAPTPMRSSAAEAVLTGSPLREDVIEEAVRAAAAECDPVSDIHADGEFRRHLVATLLERALRRVAA
jgi:carbon-monoxide dehydrogenase medium subunit/6-hydroxypseudooxynicotine dehydrogenase subunit alpha